LHGNANIHKAFEDAKEAIENVAEAFQETVKS
jgi:hypothetical protein